MAAASTSGEQRPVIDLRSDTVTRPTPGMMAAMMAAQVGDDVWGDDPTVNALQEHAAQLFGHEAGLFCPSGTMTNQIAIKVHTQPGDELICADTAHIYLYEGGGISFNSGVQPKCLASDRGRLSAAQVEGAINADDPHFPATRLVCIENTCNKGGGCYYALEAMQELSALCRRRGLRLHLDGARVFNAFVEAGYGPAQVGPLFDSVSVCLSKGLGCPVGSLLLGSREFIARARRVRKLLGGGMRQAGFLAAAGTYALQHHVERLREDHSRARALGAALAGLPWVGSVAPVDTNIVIFNLSESAPDASVVVQAFKERASVLVSQMGPRMLRAVTHLDFGAGDLAAVLAALPGVLPPP